MFRPWCSRSGALLLALLFQASTEVRGSCLESSQCRDLTTESGLLACIGACNQDFSAETPVLPVNGEALRRAEDPRKYVTGHFRWDRSSRPSGSTGAGPKREEEEVILGEGGPGPRGDGAEPGPREGKRSYSMEHFRWSKPVGKKRRPVKVRPNGAANQAAANEGAANEGAANEAATNEGATNEAAEAFPLQFKREQAAERPLSPGAPAWVDGLAAEDEGPFNMEHFRWGGPSKNKRYGGFMTSEKTQTPLVTLFKNAIIKNAHKGH